MNKEPSYLAVRYFNIVCTGVEILYEIARIDPGAIEDMGDLARRVVELTGKRTARFSPRMMDELAREAGMKLERTQEERIKEAEVNRHKQKRGRKA